MVVTGYNTANADELPLGQLTVGHCRLYIAYFIH